MQAGHASPAIATDRTESRHTAHIMIAIFAGSPAPASTIDLLGQLAAVLWRLPATALLDVAQQLTALPVAEELHPG